MTSGERCKYNKAFRLKVFKEIERLKLIGDDFSPSNIAFKFNTETKRITAFLRERDDVYCKRKAHCRKLNSPTNIRSYIVGAIDPEYYPSLWAFKGAE